MLTCYGTTTGAKVKKTRQVNEEEDDDEDDVSNVAPQNLVSFIHVERESFCVALLT